jgi:hypothetical protein
MMDLFSTIARVLPITTRPRAVAWLDKAVSRVLSTRSAPTTVLASKTAHVMRITTQKRGTQTRQQAVPFVPSIRRLRSLGRFYWIALAKSTTTLVLGLVIVAMAALNALPTRSALTDLRRFNIAFATPALSEGTTFAGLNRYLFAPLAKRALTSPISVTTFDRAALIVLSVRQQTI